MTSLLDQIEAAAKAATPGPYDYYWGWNVVFREEPRQIIADYCLIKGDKRTKVQIRNDMAYQALMHPQTALRLVEALRYAMTASDTPAHTLDEMHRILTPTEPKL